MRLASIYELTQAVDCFATMSNGERVWYRLVSREIRPMRMSGAGVAPMVKVARRDDPTDAGGWYPVRSLCFVLESGEVVS